MTPRRFLLVCRVVPLTFSGFDCSAVCTSWAVSVKSADCLCYVIQRVSCSQRFQWVWLSELAKLSWLVRRWMFQPWLNMFSLLQRLMLFSLEHRSVLGCNATYVSTHLLQSVQRLSAIYMSASITCLCFDVIIMWAVHVQWVMLTKTAESFDCSGHSVPTFQL